MRLLRAFAQLLLALILVAAPIAHARAIGSVPHSSAQHNAGPVADVAASHATHDCDDRVPGHPAHKASDCQATCCFMPGHVPSRVADARPIAYRTICYIDAARSLSGQSPAPEPGIPKSSP